ncbi:MAG: peptidoglycan bridge formation glycyltransferase FemA/FemB family protein [Candidatus Margulisbacteria bacterium]|nr:peptidoglycan bridge formation glycyltransferase FemA/FemB family protein [Candidatus Margulisiibacteriota bacterium]MBU1022465.1 peptidoglycan bridge formation glycyltransferase FemA/FemB family protein [Candidatus Margulisiibacteriota bacterium]MBU1728449.1 peptidoglycan bridge formation glycyltransferase FemA/FemB family protein [Candidatus Margulisiibacteriota bacterium]MBU1954596.1 peptidoglycan bridge formation glycyltransferase FemA/FemB family protein [Candidatus Margulisiibacteriota 
MQVKVFKSAEKDVWNEFVAAHPESPVLQSFEWGNVKAHYGWKPIRLGVLSDGRLIAGASILKRELPLIKRSIFYAPRGPVVDFRDQEAFDLLIKAIKFKAEKHKAILFKMDPDLSEKDVGSVLAIKQAGFDFVRQQVQPRTTFIIDLRKDLNEIMMSFDEKTRYNVRLAEKRGVKIVEDPSEDGVNAFYRIFQETARRDIFMIHPLSYYQKVRKELIEAGMGGIFFAYYNDQPVAAVFVFAFGGRVWYMYGASLSKYRNVMPNHALHWYVINWAKERGYKSYDLWGVPSNPTPDHPLFGVYRFKKGFGGKLVKNVGMCDLPLNSFLYHAFDRGVSLWKNVRSLLKKGKIEDSLRE